MWRRQRERLRRLESAGGPTRILTASPPSDSTVIAPGVEQINTDYIVPYTSTAVTFPRVNETLSGNPNTPDVIISGNLSSGSIVTAGLTCTQLLPALPSVNTIQFPHVNGSTILGPLDDVIISGQLNAGTLVATKISYPFFGVLDGLFSTINSTAGTFGTLSAGSVTSTGSGLNSFTGRLRCQYLTTTNNITNVIAGPIQCTSTSTSAFSGSVTVASLATTSATTSTLVGPLQCNAVGASVFTGPVSVSTLSTTDAATVTFAGPLLCTNASASVFTGPVQSAATLGSSFAGTLNVGNLYANLSTTNTFTGPLNVTSVLGSTFGGPLTSVMLTSTGVGTNVFSGTISGTQINMHNAYIGNATAGGASIFPRAEIGTYLTGTGPFNFAKGGRAQCGIMVVNVVWTALFEDGYDLMVGNIKNETGAYLCASPADMLSVPIYYNALLTPGFPTSGGAVSVSQNTANILVSQTGHTSMTASYFIFA